VHAQAVRHLGGVPRRLGRGDQPVEAHDVGRRRRDAGEQALAGREDADGRRADADRPAEDLVEDPGDVGPGQHLRSDGVERVSGTLVTSKTSVAETTETRPPARASS